MDKKNQISIRIRTGGSLSWKERKAMISEYLTGQYSKAELWKKYTGQEKEHGQLLEWMRTLGYTENDMSIQHNKTSMKAKTKHSDAFTRTPAPNDDTIAIQVKQLKEELKMANLRAEGYEEMIKIAEEAFKIPIRKKYDVR